MSVNCKGKKSKDIESPQDSIIHNTCFSSSIMNKTGMYNICSISSQQTANDNFDNFIEKRNKES